MARDQREVGGLPYYHVLVRGNGSQKIFLQDEDKEKILSILKKYSDAGYLLIIAYCILDTHAHFLLKIEKYDISTIMKKINVTYAYYYNCKYQRSGHVFYDRFQSACITDTKSILPIIRFIHNDPICIGIVQQNSVYKWSSYKAYITHSDDSLIQCKSEVLSQFDSDKGEAIEKFRAYTNEQNQDLFLDVKDRIQIKINRMIENYLIENNIRLCELGYKQNKGHKIYLVLTLKDTGKLSIRKIGEILDLSRGVVYNIIKDHDEEEN